MGRNSALSTSKLVGRVQERSIGLDFGGFVKLYLNILLIILPDIHSFIHLPTIHSTNIDGSRRSCQAWDRMTRVVLSLLCRILELSQGKGHKRTKPY